MAVVNLLQCTATVQCTVLLHSMLTSTCDSHTYARCYPSLAVLLGPQEGIPYAHTEPELPSWAHDNVTTSSSRKLLQSVRADAFMRPDCEESHTAVLV